MKSQRKILFFLLTLIVFAGFSGIISFYFLKIEIRKELKAILKSDLKPNDLITLRLSQNLHKNLKWVNRHEFIYNGNLYDVISKKNSGEEIEYTLLCDLKEESLLENLKEDYLLGKYQLPLNSKSKHVLKFNFKDYLPNNYSQLIINFSLLKTYSTHLYFPLPEFYLNHFSPPPEKLTS